MHLSVKGIDKDHGRIKNTHSMEDIMNQKEYVVPLLCLTLDV